MTDEAGSSSEWSREQDKAFENALATYPEDSADRWEKIAADVPGKTLEEIKEHYELLEEDVNRIKPLPEYSSPESSADQAGDEGASKKGSSHYNSESNHGSKSSKSDQELRKGIAWTEDEHRLFLLGLDKYGKGDWRSISRNFVVTRTPTQVASHAQKYFIRLNSMNKIGDDLASMILSVLAMQTCQHPKVRSLAKKRCCSWSYRRKINQTDSRTSCWTTWFWCARCSNYRQPVGGPLMSAVGTPVNLPAQAHMAYGVSATLPGVVVPGAPVTYPMPRTSAQ